MGLKKVQYKGRFSDGHRRNYFCSQCRQLRELSQCIKSGGKIWPVISLLRSSSPGHLLSQRKSRGICLSFSIRDTFFGLDTSSPKLRRLIKDKSSPWDQKSDVNQRECAKTQKCESFDDSAPFPVYFPFPWYCVSLQRRWNNMGKHGADRKGNLQKRKDGRWEGQYTASRPLETGAILTTTSR